ncbi:TNT domain-containing protein [Pseudactinotalea sp. HY158]|uniref:TNT domain-containing protein n=1 Tax=Pseudactinotalea sp. HY158 TaxID=2654547 RepID=UPI00129C1289|nr:TNT domain-containing protein [Pseudactinotalea sp. HY158]QGH70631.1 DUF4237 domain-containing protein [Pseudactinotalea sp. HY158]
MPAADPALIGALAAAVRSQADAQPAGEAGEAVSAEWSQAGSDHAGRLYTPAGRHPLGDDAVEAFGRLREAMTSPARGAWLSARIDVPADGPAEFTANFGQRPWWNAAGPSMLVPGDPGLAPHPPAEHWLAELMRHPRSREHWPTWLPWQDPLAEYARLREALDRAGVPRGAVRLPGEVHPYFEGAVVIRPIGHAVATAELTDYGQSVRLGDGTPAQMCRLVWDYVMSPLPPPLPLPAPDAAARMQAAAPALSALAARIRAAGPGGIATDLAPGLLFDRIGTLDGLYIYGWQAPLESRSLPSTATGAGATRVVFISRLAVPVQAELVPPWFGLPGGALRLRALDERTTVRDLVRGGALVPVRLA